MASRFSLRVRGTKKDAVHEVTAPVVGTNVQPAGLDDVSKYIAAEHDGPHKVHVQVAHSTVMNWGARHDNEDRWVSSAEACTDRALEFHTIGVLDGHDTDAASDLVSSKLPGVIAKLLKEGYSVVEAYTRAMQELEDALKTVHSSAGTCVLCCTIAGPFIWCSNLGDCRAVLMTLKPAEKAKAGSVAVPQVGKVHWLSTDQKAGMQAERLRIEKAGGSVLDGRVHGLEPSRTLGDFDVKLEVKDGVISTVPEIRLHEFGSEELPEQAILVCATDGVWDVISGQDLCNLVAARKELLDLQNMRGALLMKGDLRPLQEFADDIVKFSVGKGSRDDCTAVVGFISVS